MITHNIKCNEPFFNRIKSGVKTFEARKNDRDYQVGDILILTRYPNDPTDPINELAVLVKYILCGPGYGIKKGYCVMSIEIYFPGNGNV